VEVRCVKRGQLESNLLVLVTLALVAFGLVMVYSATSANAAVGGHDPIYYLKRQAVFAVLGVAAMIVASRWNYRALKSLAPTLVIGSLVLLAGVLVVGQQVNGARRWINLGPATFQPSEIAKIAVVVSAAAYLARRKPPQTLKAIGKPLGLQLALFCLLLLVEPDLGTAITIAVILGAMLLVAGTRGSLLLRAGGLVTAAGLLAIWIEPYRRARIFSFINPWHDAQGAGYQIVQAMIAIGSGGWFGKGLGQGIGKMNLPEAHTDMIAATIGEELGLFGLTLMILAYVVFAYAGIRIALSCKDPFGKAVAAGLTTLVCGQAALNLAAVVGIAPLTGIPLPLVSYGGTSVVVVLASVGILLNIARNGAVAAARVPDRSRGDRRPRVAVAGGGRVAERPRRPRDVRRVAGSHRSAARP
jgi:cell division protein FtsW